MRAARPGACASVPGVLAVLGDLTANEPAPGRAPYLLSPIIFPAAPPGTGQ